MNNLAEEWDAIDVPTKAANLADEWDSISTKEEPKKARYGETHVGAKGEDSAGQVLSHMVTGIGANIIGGWRGLAALASGGSLKDAATWEDAATAAQEEIEKRTYHPTSEGAQQALGVLGSKWNPMNWFAVAGRAAGEQIQDTPAETRPFLSAKGSLPMEGAPSPGPASPATAAALETGINAIPLLFPLKGGDRPVSFPKLARVVDEPGAIPSGINQSMPVMEIPKNALNTEAQGRAAVLKRIGLDNVRESALTGDAKAAATDFQTSKVDNKAGNYMRSVLDKERGALQGHAENVVSDTGGTLGSDSSTVYARGNTILAPLDDLKKWFDTNTKALYKEADVAAGGVKIEMPKTHELLSGDKAEFLGTTEGESLLKGLTARMKSLGMTDGESGGVTIAQAERLKQYLNNIWQPRTAKLIRSLSDAIDEDVTAVSPDVYAKARAMRRMRAVTLDEPNGIGRLLDASGPEHINRTVPIEKIPDTISAMPVDQLAHVIKTLENVPKELQPKAEAAMAEIRAHMANKVLDAGSSRVGQWGSRDVTRFLNNNAGRMNIVFTPEQIAKFKDLEEAGRILSKDQSYPGAAVQEHNLVQRGVMAGIRSGSAAAGGVLGGAIGGPFGVAAGGAAGDIMGANIAERFSESSALKKTQKRVVKLSEVGK